ncbi:Scr1 family TA system antitoxin-like transcriptional regulator [Nocardiopsis terrae]
MGYEAGQIFEYTLGLFGGLAQHPDYVRALMERGPVPDEAERERRLEARVERTRSILRRETPPQMWVEVSEGPSTLVRDNQNPHLDVLGFPTRAWADFLSGIREN